MYESAHLRFLETAGSGRREAVLACDTDALEALLVAGEAVGASVSRAKRKEEDGERTLG
jgi:hypothetical protein